MKCDFHNHPLSHKYYPKKSEEKIELDNEDKSKIENYINWCIKKRKLDVVAITDHDLIESSLYAKEYVKNNNIPINVITGAECEIFYFYSINSEIVQYERVHLLVLGIKKIPPHYQDCQYEDVKHFIDMVHQLGGIVIMAHPCFSVNSFYQLAPLLDGYEILNKDINEFTKGFNYCKKNNIKLKTFKNSDFHYDSERDLDFIPFHYNEEDELYIKQFLK